jgi:tripeptidyl-peptidase-1
LHYTHFFFLRRSFRYFQYSADSPPAPGFNSKGRAIPDVSLLGRNYHIVVGGKPLYVSGTSASAPVFAAFVSLVNAARRLKGLSTIGFLNPTLYATGMNASTAALFQDMTSGSNNCCGSSDGTLDCCVIGFNSTAGLV